MPFTPSHVAAVLPALRPARSGVVRARGRLLAAGLVAGSVAPDVPFFADSVLPGCHGLGRTTHGVGGVMLADPLLAAALVAGWTAVRRPMTALLPPGAQPAAARLLYGAERPGGVSTGAGGIKEAAATVGWFWASAALGAATHVAWDAFTHEGRWGVRALPLLDRRAGGVPLHHWAQYASSAAGLVATGVWLRRALRGPVTGPSEGRRAPVYVPPFVSAGLTSRQRALGAALVGVSMVAGSTARYRRERPSNLSGLIAATSFGAGGWAAPAALGWAVVARRTPAWRRGRPQG